MLNFKKFIETIQHSPFDGKYSFNNELNSLNFYNLIKLALYCVEDCFKFNSPENRSIARRVINQTRALLNNYSEDNALDIYNNNIQEIHNRIENQNTPQDYSLVAIYALLWTIRGMAENNKYIASDGASGASVNAASAFSTNNDNLDNNIFNQKISEYRSIANSLKSTRTENEPNDVQIAKKKVKFDDFGMMVNYIQDELNDNLILNKNGRYYINIPEFESAFSNNLEFSGGSYEDLLNKISTNNSTFWKYVRNYIRNLYNISQ